MDDLAKTNYVWAKFGSVTFESANPLEAEVQEVVTTNGKKLLQMELKANDVNYVGGSRPNPDENYGVLLYSQRTGKVKVVEAAYLDLHPEAEGSEDDEPAGGEKLSHRDKVEQLVEAFGRKKQIRKINVKRSYIVKPRLLEQVMRETAHASSLSAADVTPVVKVSVTLPDYDLAAATPQDAYPIGNILPEKLRKYLHQELPAESSEDVFDANWVPSFVLERRRKDISPVELENLNFLRFLIMLLHSRKSLSEALYNVAPLPVLQHIVALFCDNFSKISAGARLYMSDVQLDKLRCFILVLALHISKFHLPYEALMKDMKVPLKIINARLTAIGCKLTKGAVPTAKLPIPLTFPKASGRKR